jgi:hypothetical protein
LSSLFITYGRVVPSLRSQMTLGRQPWIMQRVMAWQRSFILWSIYNGRLSFAM